MKVLRYLISQIDASRRQLFVEHELWGTPILEIAAAQGLPVATAKKRLRLAWIDIDEAAKRWQAEQRRRGLDTRPAALFPPIVVDIQLLTRRGMDALRTVRGRVLGVSAAVAVIGAALLPMRLAPEPAMLAPMPDVPIPSLSPMTTRAAVAGVTSAARAGASPRPDTASPKPSRPSSIPTEESLILQADVLLDSYRSAEALETLARHEQAFPDGRLAVQRESLRTRAKSKAACP